MNRRGIRLSASTLAAFLLVTQATAPVALSAAPTPASGSTWGQNQRVEFRWKEGVEPPTWARPSIKAAAGDSNSSRKAKAAVFLYDPSGPATIAYTDDMPTNYAIGYAVRNIPHSFSIKIRPHGTQLDWGTLRWCQFYDEPPNGCYDLEMVTLHEFGHAQTLGHAIESETDQWTDSIMHASAHSKARVGWNQSVFGRCDVARLQIRYEPLTTSTAISTCLSLATQLTLTPSSSSATYGSTVTFTSRLSVAADEVWPNLAGQSLSSRAVVLQRRAPMGSLWSTVATMNPATDDAGKYVKTITLTKTYDWRAVFNTPADEGLKGTSSTSDRIVVANSLCDGITAEEDYNTC